MDYDHSYRLVQALENIQILLEHIDEKLERIAVQKELER